VADYQVQTFNLPTNGCRRLVRMTEYVVMTAPKMTGWVDAATSKVSESSGCVSACVRRRVTGKQTQEHAPRSLGGF